MKLILARHGETIENLQGIFQGHLHGVLSEKGKQQAEALAQELKEEKIDIAYSSDLDRASDTAKIILKFHPHIKLQLVAELRERFLGHYQGKKRSELGLPENYSIANIEGTEIESLKELCKRAETFLKTLLATHKEETILCVGHSGILRAIIVVIQKKPPEEILNLEKMSNAGYKTVKLERLD